MTNYDRLAAINYAQKWALGHNPEFYHFSGIGGDCSNFVSQCLLAGGGKMNYDKIGGWYYIDLNHRSPSWTSVEQLKRFLISNNKPGPFGEMRAINHLEIGDIIQLRQNPERFNHSVIITKIDANEIYVCAHSDDALNRPLSSYAYLEIAGIHIVGVNE